MTETKFRKTMIAMPWLMLAALLPVMIFRDFTPSNELRYLSIADEALRDGHLFAFYNQGLPYADKPPMYLWIVMCGKLLFGRHLMWFLGLFSFIPAVVTAYVMDRWVRHVANYAMRVAAMLMLMSSGLFLALEFVLRMDMLLSLFIVLSLYEYWKFYRNEPRCHRSQWLFGLWVFLAIFAKGPMGILIPLVSTAVFAAVKRKWGVFACAWGWRTWTVLLLACGSWFLAVWCEGGNSYLSNLLFNQTINRAVDSFTHKRPFWYYGTVIWYATAPWCLLVVGIMIRGLAKRRFQEDLSRFFLTVAVSTFVMLSCISSKLGVYLLPAIPFMIYYTCLALPSVGLNRWVKLSLAVPAAIFIVSPVALAVVARGDLSWISSAPLYVAAGLLAAGGAMCLIALYKRITSFTGAVASLAVAMYAALFAAGFDMNNINVNAAGYRELCELAVKKSDGMEHPRFYTYKLYRSSAINVFLGTQPVDLTEEDLVEGKGRDGVVLAGEEGLQDPALTKLLRNADVEKSGPNAVILFHETLPSDSLPSEQFENL